jgi:hypothetical protein
LNLKKLYPSDLEKLKTRVKKEIERQRQIASAVVRKGMGLFAAVCLTPKITLGVALLYGCCKPKEAWKKGLRTIREFQEGFAAPTFISKLEDLQKRISSLS